MMPPLLFACLQRVPAGFRPVIVLAVLLGFLSPGWAAQVKPDVIVAADGSGQFTSIQDAISSAPINTSPDAPRWVIRVKPGTYHERVNVQRERGHLHVIGDDAATTTLAYHLNATTPAPEGEPPGTFGTPTLQVDGDGMVWENITIANTGGVVGQAVALRADGDQLVFKNCRFLGWQDTLVLNRGHHFFENCYVEGHVDFIFGGATAYFERCELHALAAGYITAASTPKDQPYGFVFVDCRITGANGAKTFLGRPWREFARTVFIRTEMADVVQPAGWHNGNKPGAEHTTYYAEFESTGPGGRSAGRVGWVRTLTAEDLSAYSVEKVLGRSEPDATSALPDRPPVGVKKGPRIVLVGDSTVTDTAGWGPGFKQWLRPEVECFNTARGGRSSKSFRDEGRWGPALELKGDYYLIQFGHNDQPGKGPQRETDPATTFAENMGRYVDDVRAIGGQPVLVTSLARREFNGADPKKIGGTLSPYVEAVRRVAAAKHVPLVDLYAASVRLCERLGPEACEQFNKKTATGVDRTHLDAAGSRVFGALVAEELRRVLPNAASFLHEESTR